MDIQNLSTLTFLKERKKVLEDELKDINRLLGMLQTNGSPPEGAQRDRSTDMQWSNKVDMVFKDFNGELSFKQVRNKLVEMGVQEAKDPSYRGSINACLARKVKQGSLERPRIGIYRKKKKSPDIMDFIIPDNEKEDNT